ncbi:protein translocase subunit SecD [Lachnospiraceae bacterium YH-ros2226]
MKKKTGILALVLIAAIIVFLGWYSFGVIKNTIKGNKKGLKLGLDLAGGVSITYQADKEHPSKQDMEDTIQKLQSRIEHDLSDKASTTEANVYQVGDNRITVEIPGVSDANAILEELGTPGNLYFIKQTDASGNNNYNYDQTSGEYKLAEGKTIESLQKEGSIVLTGTEVKTAKAGYTQDQTTGNQSPIVEVSLNKKGTKAFGDATTEAYKNGQTIGIYYDGRFVSVPTVQAAITNGNCQITGMSDIDEANQLASYIRIGGLKINLKEVQSQVVSAQLGGNALKTSLIAAFIGILIIFLFMILAYRILGLGASLALLLYTELMIGILDQFTITLTLPGIAGIILSIGMAVDANSIIFARIKEEIGLEHTVASAIEAGFHKALSAIIDGNMTTLIAAAVLGLIGTGTVRGFAVTLAIGVVLSLFTAFFISRTLIRAFYAIGIRDEKFYGKKLEKPSLKFVEKRVVFFSLSLAVIIAGFVGMGVYKAKTGKALNYSLEFSGGTSTTIATKKQYTLSKAEKEIVPLFEKVTGDSDVQATVVNSDKAVIIKTRTLTLKEREAVNASLKKNLGIKESAIQNENISSTISGEMRRTSLIAVIVAVLLMLVYIWFRFRDIRFGSSAVIALAHDVLVTLAVYALARLSVGSTFIACILTIIGYSINDTIVVFDRIRENLTNLQKEKRNRETLKELCDRSITETLTRSLSTSFTTIVMVIMLEILGVSAIRAFAFPLMIGLISGTYSSICLATELWYLMSARNTEASKKENQGKKAGKKKKNTAFAK